MRMNSRIVAGTVTIKTILSLELLTLGDREGEDKKVALSEAFGISHVLPGSPLKLASYANQYSFARAALC